MFFTLSKILGSLLNPMLWILGLLLAAILLKKWRNRLLITTAFLFYLLSNSAIIGLVSNAWDYKSIKIDEIQEPYDLGIVLSGYAVLDSDMANFSDLFHFGNNTNRLTQSIELYKMGKMKKIMISGGSGHLLGEKISEAIITEDFLIKMGVDENDILLETESRNTVENAVQSKLFLDDHLEKFERILLLTSPFHMRRSMMVFRKQGIQFTPFSVGNYSDKYHFQLSHLLPHPHNIPSWYSLMKEWTAMIVYRLLGYG